MVYYDKISKLATLSSVELVNGILKNTENKGQEQNDREIISWKNSLPLLIKVISQSGLDDLDLVIEYETPLHSRIDAILTGFNKTTGRPTAMIIELKQWESIDLTYTESMTEIKLINVDEATSIRTHPIAQTNTYRKHLEFNHSNLGDNQIDLIEVQYLHNYLAKQELFSKQYRIYQTRRDNCFVKGEEDKFIQLLKDTFDNRQSDPITTLIVEGQYSMEKQGYENLAKVLNSEDISPLLDEQRDVSVRVSKLFKTANKRQLTVISGDCGTGKTYIGLYFLKLFMDITNSKKVVFTVTSKILNAIINGHTESKIPYVNGLRGEFDLVIIDEAHRLQNVGETLDNLYKKNKAKFVIVLQDDRQRVRINEEGLIAKFSNYAIKNAIDIEYHQEHLAIQKRSMYQSSFVDRINDLFSFAPIIGDYKEVENYGIEICSQLNEIDGILNKKIIEENKCQWFAPFCWEWSRNVKKNDVQIPEEDFAKPWNPINNQFEWYSELESYHKDRIGCIYTAQGLDFDYVGFIFWTDLKWSSEKNDWIVDLNQNKDFQFIKEIVAKYGGVLKAFNYQEDCWMVDMNGTQYKLNRFIAQFGNPLEVKELVLNTYRVLFTRARKGIYLWFKDEETQEKVSEFLK